jgi:excisionase family DNA binding protein
MIYFRVAEIAKLLKVKPDKIQLWIRNGELEAFNVASKPIGQPRWRIPADALVAFQAKRAAAPTEAPPSLPKRRPRRVRPPMEELVR